MEDLRVTKTKLIIKQSFLSLVEEVGFDNVYVSDIAKRAMINRNTFYLHYDSKEDLVQKIANESILSHLSNLDIVATFKSRNKRKVLQFFTNIIDAIDDNLEIYRIYLINPSMAGYLQLSVNKVYDYIFTFIKKTVVTRLEIEYLISGIIGIVSKWIVYAIGTKEQVIKVLTEMAFATGKQIYFSMR